MIRKIVVFAALGFASVALAEKDECSRQCEETVNQCKDMCKKQLQKSAPDKVTFCQQQCKEFLDECVKSCAEEKKR